MYICPKFWENLKRMKVGIIIPDRGDRPEFLKNCLRMLAAQTLQPFVTLIIDFPPTDNNIDITKRYRIGYEEMRKKGVDVIALWENDDWYAPNYLETMLKKWIEAGMPDIFGTDNTIYYHIKLFALHTMFHVERSSAMSTFIKPGLFFNWCPDDEPYTDMHLWATLKGKVFRPEKLICLGIKHGVGLCGGYSHVTKLHRFTQIDLNKDFLRNNLDETSFEFYSNYFNQPTQA